MGSGQKKCTLGRCGALMGLVEACSAYVRTSPGQVPCAVTAAFKS